MMPYPHLKTAVERRAAARIDTLRALDRMEMELTKLKMIASEHHPAYRCGVINDDELQGVELYLRMMSQRALNFKP